MSYTSDLWRDLQRQMREYGVSGFVPGSGDLLLVVGSTDDQTLGLLDISGVADGWVLTRDSAADHGVKWAAPSGGGGGTSNHAGLTNLPWTASGHTGAANRLAAFDGGGAAVYAALPLAVANGGTGAGSESGARAALGLVIGTDVQAQDAQLQAIANLTPSADQIAYWTGAGSAALTGLSAFVRTLLDDIDAPAARTTLGAADTTLSFVLINPDASAPNGFELVGGALTAITTSSTVQIDTYFSGEQLLAGRATPGAGVGEELTISEVLDWLSSTHGAVLYRDAGGWAALAPGTAGHVLTTQGAGADPIWQAAGGGGGGLSQAQVLSRASLRA